MKDQRFKSTVATAWIGMLGNLSLALMKGCIGFLSGSKALIADAMSSFTDAAGLLTTWMTIRKQKGESHGKQPLQPNHVQSITAMILSAILILFSLEMVISTCKSMFAGITEAPHGYAFIAIAASIVVKEMMFQYHYRLGNRVSSTIILTAAKNHRSDVFVSLIACSGMTGAWLGMKYGFTWMLYLDPIAALVIAGLLIRVACRMIADAASMMTDQVLEGKACEELVCSIMNTRGVIRVDELRTREYGSNLIIEVRISVNPHITVSEGQQIAHLVKMNLTDEFSHVSDVLVHVSPYDARYPYKELQDQFDSTHVLH